LTWGTGAPVEPEVKTRATTCSRSISGISRTGRGHRHRFGIAEAGQVNAFGGRFLIGDAEDVRGDALHLPDHLRGVGGGQQADAAADDAGRQGDRETVAVAAQVEHMAPRRQLAGDMLDLGQKPAGADGRAAAPGHDGIEAAMGDERQG
jgi:hypothetical protein